MYHCVKPLVLLCCLAGCGSGSSTRYEVVVGISEDRQSSPLPESRIPEDTGRHSVHRCVLPNGLKVLSFPKPGAGFAIVQLWVGTGSMHEEEYTGRGLSHYLEHALFDGSLSLNKGNVKRPGFGNEEIQKIIKAGGGYMNAFTNHENTCYMMEVLPAHVVKAVSLMEPLVMRPDLREDVLSGEKGEIRAVLNELRRNREDTGRELWERHFEHVWGKSLYGVPIIGWESAVANARVEELKSYHARRYVPNNMVLVVVGEMDPVAVEKAAREAWVGDDENNPIYPAGPLKDVPLKNSNMPTGNRDLRIPCPKVADCQVKVSFSAPSWNGDPGHVTGLLLLDMLLSSPGQGGALQRLIQEDPRFHCREIGTAPSIHDEDATLDVMFTCERTEHIDPIVNAVTSCLALLAKNLMPLSLWSPVGARPLALDEISRARDLVLLSQLRDWESLEEIAGLLGKHECSHGDFLEHHRRLEAVRATGSGSVASAARSIAVAPRVLTAFVPESKEEVRKTVMVAAEAPTSETLPGGVELCIQQDGSAPFFAITYAMKGGVLVETEENNGIGMLLAQWLGQIPEADALDMDARGLSFNAESGSNSLLAKISGPKTQLGWALAYLKRRLFVVSVDENSFKAAQDRCVGKAESSLKNPEAEVIRRSRSLLFKGLGYAFMPQGDPKALRAQTSRTLEAFRLKLKSSPSALALVGDLGSREALKVDIGRLFLDIKVPASKITLMEPTLPASREVVDVPFGTKQCYIQWVFPGAPMLKDEAARTVVQRVLGQRVYAAVRTREGLSYSAGFFTLAGFGPTMQVLYADTDTYEKINVIRDAFASEILKMREELLTKNDLLEAASAAAFEVARSSDSAADRAQQFALNRLYGKPLNDMARLAAELERLNPESVRDYCRRWLKVDTHYEVLVRDSSASPPPTWSFGRKR